MQKKSLSLLVLLGLFTSAILMFSSCNKEEEDDEDNTADNKSYALVIENGAQNVEPGKSVNYNAVLVDSDGEVSSTSDVTWSVSPDSVGTFSGNVFSTSATGEAKVTATVTKDGSEISASVPIGVYQPSFFAVAPSAILYESGHDIQLNAVYFGDQNPSFSYSSDDESVATVSSNGLVNLVGSGECVITVTASTQPDRPFYVPVMVVGPPTVALPITRVELNKYSTNLFKDESETLSATAYDAEGNEVTDASFTWESSNTNVATVSSNGEITPVRTGKTHVSATADGIRAQCEVLINPDTVVIVSPLYVSMQQGESYQFSATAYENTRNGLGQEYAINFNWVVPDYGPGFEMFNIATVDNTGNVTMENDAMMGMSTVVIAHDPDNIYVAGGAMVMVDMGMPF
jgi:hypothetical protein